MSHCPTARNTARNTAEHGLEQRKGLQIEMQRWLQGNCTKSSKVMGASSEDTALPVVLITVHQDPEEAEDLGCG